MFESTKKPVLTIESGTDKLNLDQEKDLIVENVPVRTMKKDIENINNPEYFSSLASANLKPVTKGSPEKIMSSPNDVNARQRTSPFFSQENKDLQKPFPLKDSPKTKNNVPEGATNHPLPRTNWPKIITVAIIIFAVFASAFAGYYFWMTRNNNSEIPPEASLPPAEEPVAPGLNEHKANYFSIDTEKASQEKVKEAIGKYANQIVELKYAGPIEFLVTDSQNNPVSFETFTGLMDIKLSDSVKSHLGKNFNLFIFNDGGKNRLGIAVDTLDPTGNDLKQALLENENDLPRNIESLFLSPQYTIEPKPFGTSYFGGAEIRYFNVISPEELSTDYTIFRNKLIIGTTKMTLRSIIDYYLTGEADGNDVDKNETGGENGVYQNNADTSETGEGEPPGNDTGENEEAVLPSE